MVIDDNKDTDVSEWPWGMEITYDVIETCILPRVPWKDLLRLRAVSRYWASHCARCVYTCDAVLAMQNHHLALLVNLTTLDLGWNMKISDFSALVKLTILNGETVDRMNIKI